MKSFFLQHLKGMGETEDEDEEDLQYLFFETGSSTRPHFLRNTPSTLSKRAWTRESKGADIGELWRDVNGHGLDGDGKGDRCWESC